jgi:hypothetical protein
VILAISTQNASIMKVSQSDIGDNRMSRQSAEYASKEALSNEKTESKPTDMAKKNARPSLKSGGMKRYLKSWKLL